MDPSLALGVGFVVGAAFVATAAFLFGRDKFRTAKENSARELDYAADKLGERDERYEKDRKELEAQVQEKRDELEAYKRDEGRMASSFTVLANQVLEGSKNDFMQLAITKLDPFDVSHKELNTAIARINEERRSEYGNLTTMAENLRSETQGLAALLRSTTERGGWGEFQLIKVLELAGLTKHVTVEVQVRREGKQPDAVVKLPGHRLVVIDAKFPFNEYAKAMEAESEEDRKNHMKGHVKAVDDHIKELSLKKYYERPETIDFVIMFIPIEPAYYAAIRHNPDYLGHQSGMRVILAGPLTLLTLLRSVAYGWRAAEMVKNAGKIADVAKNIQARAKTLAGHINDIGKGIEGTRAAFSKLIGGWRSRSGWEFQVRKLEDLMSSEEGQKLEDMKEVEALPLHILDADEEE